MKISLSTILIPLALIAACVSPSKQVTTTFDMCKKSAMSGPERAAIASKLFPKTENIDVVMMSNTTVPPLAELEAAKPYFRDRLACNRTLITDMGRINGASELMITNAKLTQRKVEEIVADFLSGGVTYGSYFTRLKNASDDHSDRTTLIKAQAKQESQRRSSPKSTFKPYCPPSKYPIYGCGNTSSTSSSPNRNPPGSKECTYKSGPYKWTKTIKGYTCPATDNSGGYFGTLVR